MNLFPPSLGDLELPARIDRILTDGDLTAGCMTVEITEDFLLGNVTRARRVLEMLRELGIRVAIDDFGSGYSALSYLREQTRHDLCRRGHRECVHRRQTRAARLRRHPGPLLQLDDVGQLATDFVSGAGHCCAVPRVT